MLKPYLAKIELTPECSNACIYCFNVERNAPRKELTPYQKWMLLTSLETKKENLRKILERFHSIGFKEVTYTGGEPTLQKELLLFGIREARKNNLKPSLNTNLKHVTQEDISAFADAGLESILASYASSDPVTFTSIMGATAQEYAALTALLPHIVASPLKLEVNMVAVQQNKNQVYTTGEFLHKECGVNNFGASPITPTSHEQNAFALQPKEILEVMDQLLLLHERHGMSVFSVRPYTLCLIKDPQKYFFITSRCTPPESDTVVTLDGDVRFCTMINDGSFGSIFTDSFDDILTKLFTYKGSLPLDKACTVCVEYPSCGGGCPVDRMHAEGSIYQKRIPFKHPLDKRPHVEALSARDIFIRQDLDVEELPDGKYKIRAQGLPGTAVQLDVPEFTLLQIIYKEKNQEQRNVQDIIIKHNLREHFVNVFLTKLYKKGYVEVHE
ncbi:MAG: radical SAM protein [archaeon]